jgi:hypothetical protein
MNKMNECMKRYAGAKELSSQCFRIPFIKTFINENKFNQYLAPTTLIPKRETTINLFHPEDGGRKFLDKTSICQIIRRNPLEGRYN